MSIAPNRDAERLVDSGFIQGSAFSSASAISAGFAVYLSSLIETVTGIALRALESCCSYLGLCKGRADTLHASKKAELKPIPGIKVDPKSGDKLFLAPPPLPGLFAKRKDNVDGLKVASLFPSAKKPTQTQDLLELTTSDKVLAGSNLAQWGLVGAGLYGVSPTIVIPLSVLSSLGVEIATFCTLPKDASWLRKAMSIPFLAKILLTYNPWVARFLQVTSLFNLAQSAGSKIKTAWEQFSKDPVKSLKTGAVHLFNLASGVTFAAESAGLFKFESTVTHETNQPQPQKPCNPKNETDCQGPINRKIRICTAYSNRGPDGKKRQVISDLTSKIRQKYADMWGIEHVESTTSLVDGQCFNPIISKQENCTPQWNKIKFLRDWCEEPSNFGDEEISILMDDDAVITNFRVNPFKAFDQLRSGVNSSFVLATEGEGNRANPGAVNTGVMLLRKDGKGCEVIRRVWENRNTVHSLSDTGCPTFGLCTGGNFGPTQAAVDKVLWQDAPYLDKTVVTRVLSRDSTHPYRANIAFNTLNRGGCFTALQKDGSLSWPYDINKHDLRVNPEGRWQEGDWIGQTGGYPLYGQDLSQLEKCENDPSLSVEPIRLKKVQRMADAAERTLQKDPRILKKVVPHHVKIKKPESSTLFIPPIQPPDPKRKILFGAVYDNSGDPNREPISEFVNQNHKQYSDRHGMEHTIVTGNLVKGQCSQGFMKEQADCAPYWNKIARIREWLREPRESDVEEWYYYVDDDMLVMNMKVDPSKAIDELRGGRNTSFIIAEDVIDWQKWFFETSDPYLSVNTGAMIIRKDERSKKLIDAVWELRHHPVAKPSPECTNIGNCKFQEKSMQEQEAFTILLRDNPHLVGDVVTIVPPRDTQSSTRAHLAMNTFYRGGCLVKKNRAGQSEAFSYDSMDQAVNPDGAFKQGDWLTQAAGVPVWGKEVPRSKGSCLDDPSVLYGPLRLTKLQTLEKQVIR